MFPAPKDRKPRPITAEDRAALAELVETLTRRPLERGMEEFIYRNADKPPAKPTK